MSYSHLDREWQGRLMGHLAILERWGLVHVWADTRIDGGADWRRTIDEELAVCQVAVLLVTANFLGSDFIHEVEVKALLERHEADGLILLPVIARPCAWRLVDWLAGRQCRPNGGRALSSGAESEVDSDLALLTYEIGARLGQNNQAVAAEMAQLSSERASSAFRLADERADATMAALPTLAGLTWHGTYRAIHGDYQRVMALSIQSTSAAVFEGHILWDEKSKTRVEGRLELSSAIKRSGVWAETLREASRPLCGLRFTDVARHGDPRLELNGDYRAILQDDMTVGGLWYQHETDSEPIGRFALRADPPALGAQESVTTRG